MTAAAEILTSRFGYSEFRPGQQHVVDGPSADPVDSTTQELHRLWLSAGRMIIENVANLTELPTRSQVVVAPIKLAGGNGGPARIFALLPDEHNGR